MAINTNESQEKAKVIIQFPITVSEYAELQRVKSMSSNPMQLNKDFYREQLLKSIQK